MPTVTRRAPHAAPHPSATERSQGPPGSRPAQIRAHEAGVKQREEELAKVRESQGRAEGHRPEAASDEDQRAEDQGSRHASSTGRDQQGVPDPQGPDRRRQDGQQRAGRRNPRDDGPTRRFGPKIAEAEKVLKTTQEKLAAARRRGQAAGDQSKATSNGSKASCGVRGRVARRNSRGLSRGREPRARTPWPKSWTGLRRLLLAGARQRAVEHPHVAAELCRSCGRLLYIAEEK